MQNTITQTGRINGRISPAEMGLPFNSESASSDVQIASVASVFVGTGNGKVIIILRQNDKIIPAAQIGCDDGPAQTVRRSGIQLGGNVKDRGP